ncbi:MAG: Multifunctional CCA protein [Candidatus Dichloromethanomonas elyunquensis]|nr:MAG: Multifunctional CCA protein [Candidatus Dichloromethanomonas elyunquensis]
MKIILSHRYLDFDALASMVAVQRIYPDAALVIEGKNNSYVQDFLALTKEHLPLLKLKDIDTGRVEKIFLVDTHELSRSVGNKNILDHLNEADIEIIDHHPFEGSVEKKHTFAMVGACTTILVEKIKNMGLRLSSFDATLMALGIYDDTGSLLFENTTSRDVMAVAYLIDQGAQLGVVAEYLRKPLSSEQMDLFQLLLDNGSTELFEGTPVYITFAEQQDFVEGLALLAQRIGEIESADIWFIVAQMENRVHIVARSRGNVLPVNKIVGVFGGSGHEKAASAVIKEGDLHEVMGRLREEIQKRMARPSQIRDIMSFPVKTVYPDTTMEEVGKILLKYGHTGVPVVENDMLVGIISRRDVDKALKHGLQHAPAKGFMTKDVVTVNPDLAWEEVQKLMVFHDIGRLPVVENGHLVGIVSRSDILRLIYGRAVPTTSLLARERSLARREDTLALINNLPEDLKSALIIIKDVAALMDEPIYLVGGFVRDLLLGVPMADLDIVVEGDGIAFAKQLHEKLFPKKMIYHQPFGTAKIVMNDGTHFDIAGSRREDYDYPGALPTVEESTLRNDLFRRDFTINAMAMCLNRDRFGEVIDFYGGFRDLQQGEIRFLHNLSFIDDPMRIMRAIRFAERYGFKLAKNTGDAIGIALEADVFAKISPERFTEELLLVYQERHYQKMGRKLIEYGVFRAWFGQDFPWNYHKEEETAAWPLEKRWLMSLKSIDDQGVNQILARLKINKNLHKNTIEYLRLRQELRVRISDLTKIDEVLMAAPRNLVEVLSGHEEFEQGIRQYLQAAAQVDMEITGIQLMESGMKEGPEIGKTLRKIRSLWLEGKITSIEEEKKYVDHIFSTGRELIE